MPIGLTVRQTNLAAVTEGSSVYGTASRMGHMVTMDFYTWAALAGAGFQVRAGTITTPLVGRVAIADATAEYCVDCVSGYTIIPVNSNISIRLGATLTHEYAIKSVATVSSAGAAFVPLPLRNASPNGGAAIAAITTARVAAAGGVTVTAELATTTLRHWSWSNPTGNTTAGTNLGIFGQPPLDWSPQMPPVLAGARCLYAQIAAATTGPSYYASLDYLEFLTSNLI